MPSTVYKGDLAEVTFGHETGLYLAHGSPASLDWQITQNNDNTTTIALSGSTEGPVGDSSYLLYPKNMLVGARLRIVGGGNFADDDYANHGHVYTIIENHLQNIKVTPAMKEADSTGAEAGDAIIIDGFGVPSLDRGMTSHTDALTADESVLTDQFLGLAGTVTLPETKADIKRYHVVGLGRDVAVQAPGKFSYEGGSFDVSMHSARWLYYALGGIVTVPSQLIPSGTFINNVGGYNSGTSSAMTVDGVNPSTNHLVVGDTLFNGAGTSIGVLTATGSNTLTVGGNTLVAVANDEELFMRPKADTSLNAASSAGQTYVDLSQVSSMKTVNGADSQTLAVGDYICIYDIHTGTNGGNLLAVPTHKSVDTSTSTGTSSVTIDGAKSATNTAIVTDASPTPQSGFNIGEGIFDDGGGVPADVKFVGVVMDMTGNTNITLGAGGLLSGLDDGDALHKATTQDFFGGRDFNTYAEIHDDSGTRFDKSCRSEIRRVTAISGTRVYLDDALLFSHDKGVPILLYQYGTDTKGSPSFVTGSTTEAGSTASRFGRIENAVNHLMFTHTELPSFALETSVRKRDTGSYSGEDSANAPGSSTDSGQLTRVFRGCKVGSFTMSADTDAAVKLTIGFNAAHCYTDTGRLDASNAGDRYTAHRMFENTANTDTARLESGIGAKTQKPFFFYNGSVSVAGKSVAQVTTFSLTGSTGVTHVHTIGSSPAATNTNTTSGLSLDQVPFGGSRNPSIAVAGKATYDMSMEIITDDPTFFHHMRATDEFNTRTGTSKDGIKLSFTKQGDGDTRERITIFIDEYYIAEAPIPIPEDKGMIRSALKIVPQTIKVVSTDTIYHY